MIKNPISLYTPEMGAVLLWNDEWENPVVGEYVFGLNTFVPLTDDGDIYVDDDTPVLFTSLPTHFTRLDG